MPRYGIDALVLSPPLALIASITLLLGISGVGFIFLQFLTKKRYLLLDSALEQKFYSPIIGAGIFGALIYPALLFGNKANVWLSALA